MRVSASVLTVLWVSGFGSWHGCSLGTQREHPRGDTMAGLPTRPARQGFSVRDDDDGSGLCCSCGYATTLLQVTVLLYLVFAHRKCSETLPSALTRLLQSQAVKEEISSLQLPSREGAVAGFCCMRCRLSREIAADVLGYPAVLPAHLNPDRAAPGASPQGTPVLVLCPFVFTVGL